MKIKNIQFEDEILAVFPERLNEIISLRQAPIIESSFDGDIQAAINRRATKFKNIKGQVVTVPLHGFISHKATIWSAMGFETSSETFGNWLADLANNRDVGAIVIDVDSPGGTVAGISGVADKIFALRGKKPIIAVVNDLMASAAYWLASAAEEIVADPDSLTGSIGVVGIHMDWSAAFEMAGIKPTIIKAGEFKAEGNPFEPLSDEAKEFHQNRVDAFFESFVSAVARHRGISAGTVKSDFGKGRVFLAAKAKSVGMIDRIATKEQVMNDLMPAGTGKSVSRARAELELIKTR